MNAISDRIRIARALHWLRLVGATTSRLSRSSQLCGEFIMIFADRLADGAVNASRAHRLHDAVADQFGAAITQAVATRDATVERRNNARLSAIAAARAPLQETPAVEFPDRGVVESAADQDRGHSVAIARR